MAVKHGLAWSKIQKMSDEELAQSLAEYELSDTGTRAENEVAVWEASLPIYKIPANLPEASNIVFRQVLDEDDEPRPEGASRTEIIEALLELGYPDEASANQSIETQIRNLVTYYGYRVVPASADVIIVEKR